MLVAVSKRDKMMGSPRPGYGRVNRVYEPQGSYGYGRLGPPPEGESILNPTVTLGHTYNYIVYLH